MLGDSLRENPKNRLSKDYLEPETFLNQALTGRFAMVEVNSISHWYLRTFSIIAISIIFIAKIVP
jgi:hypothetical protein